MRTRTRVRAGAAALAGAALLTLLPGTGATYALWSDAATLPGLTMRTGVLDVALTALTWFDAEAELTARGAVDIDLAGSGMTALLTAAWNGPSDGAGPASGAWAPVISVGGVVLSDDGAPAHVGTFGAGTRVPVEVTVAFEGGVAGEELRTETLDLGTLTVTLAQDVTDGWRAEATLDLGTVAVEIPAREPGEEPKEQPEDEQPGDVVDEPGRPPHAGLPGRPPHAGVPGRPPHAVGPDETPDPAPDLDPDLDLAEELDTPADQEGPATDVVQENADDHAVEQDVPADEEDA